MQWAAFDYAFMFKYSERPGTLAASKLHDDVPDPVKSRRLEEVIHLQQKLSNESNKKDIGKIMEVLAEGRSRKSEHQLYGRNSQNKVVVFPAGDIHPGEYIRVKITACTPATLMGEALSAEHL
jgi:tRNA-2-methylthio-N6-dimethylallyladenosine synthase